MKNELCVTSRLSVFAWGRKKAIAILATFFILHFSLFTSSCSSTERAGKTLQRELNTQIEHATALAQHLAEHLQNEESLDTLWALTRQEEHIITFIYDSQRRPVFWTHNWLSGSINLFRYNRWYYQQFNNAHGIYCWTWAGKYNVLTIIPIKYAYPFSNDQLHNTYLPPFSLRDRYSISRERNQEGHVSIVGPKEEYLFSICQGETHEHTEEFSGSLSETISYQSLLPESERPDNQRYWISARLYLLLDVLIFAALLIVAIVALIKYKGLRRMGLGRKFFYVLLSLLLLLSVYIFTASTIFVQHRYEARQRTELEQQTRYIQKSLQELYFWKVSLTPNNTQGINIHLRDLALTYRTDIHVYDINGNLVGTSSPELFEKGLISKHIAPEPFFSENSEMILEEQIGDIQYLCGYAPLVNGSYVQIGYIAIPRFLSEEEVLQETDSFASRLFPAMLIVLVLAIFLSIFFSRTFTRPLRRLAENMRNFHIGNPNNHLQYDNEDEIGSLVAQYNKMVDELEHSTERLALSERETAWRTMARQIAHEINNPLTPMKLTIQQLQRTKKANDERFDKYFDKSTALLIDQIDSLSHIAKSFSDFAKMPVVVTHEVDIAEKLFGVISLFRNNEEHVPLRYIGAEYGIQALADSEQISQVFSNLIKNALQAIEHKENGDIIVILKELADTVEISVSDNGAGIPEEIHDKVFRPNFTTKSTGMGLGLAISKNIVEGSGGTIRFESSSKGTTFFVTLRKP